ncbi:EAL domain-containing protein [Rhodoferax sp.]|uniref:bifunctional diguanylate cyclase/phosphodiesterase n=1 Tax=Rhodoferax sp. TaxID=50421 RepID=UPI0028404EFB|nr:EAL domain-containing protein [Rhodoferax sp.]MDR3370259.1 EAL domain-containing protein [Rhodoferax sp.]
MLISAVTIRQIEINRLASARANAYALANDRATEVQNHLDRALSAVYALSALVQQSQGAVRNFDDVAIKMLPNYPGVSIMIMAPGGIISHAIPKAGNEKAIGLDLLQDPVMKAETQLARNTGLLTLAGPLPLRQGGEGLVARLPIFLDQANGGPIFWGFTNIVLRLPQALDSARLPSLTSHGLDYKLWRVDIETGKAQTIIESSPAELSNPVKKSIDVPNGAWTLSVAPHAGWGAPMEMMRNSGIGLALSMLIAYLAKLQMRQIAHKNELEQQVDARTHDIEASKQQLAATLDAIPDPLFEMGLDGTYYACHVPHSHPLAATVQSFLGHKVTDVMPQQSAQVLLDALLEAHTSGVSNGKQLMQDLPQGPQWFELSVARKLVGSGAPARFIVISHDITTRKEYEDKLTHIAHFDALTHLPNRVLLSDRLQQAMAQMHRRGKQLVVVYLDLDGFKAINDQHGHAVGDRVLITLTHRMKLALREGDTLARIGGDEFVVVLIDLENASDCLPLVNRLLEVAAQPMQVGEFRPQVSASLGITFYPQAENIEPDQLLRQADQAMYQAKVAGKNRYHVFDAAQDSTIRGHHESLERIRLSLTQNELVLHYQPQVNMRSGKVIGAEALIRWQHPEKGLLAPSEFLPVIEDHPLAIEVGEWVIGTALTQIEQWHSTGLKLHASVNIGASQLQQSDFVARLQSILAAHPQVNPTSLKLEVLETSALSDMAQVSQVIKDCAQLGVMFALDDFGTGYSSLTYLKRLNVAMLKIDQSFVRDMLDDPDDLAILQGVIGLAAAFKRQVIAEGVETVAHGTALLHLGCELAQGYGIARPMPGANIPAWVAAWQPDAAWSELPWLGSVAQNAED